MTRSILIALFAVSTALVGCATEGADSDVAVITADLDDQHFELVEMHDADGFIDVDVYYSVGQAEEIAHETFRWPAADPTPTPLLERLATIDYALLQDVRPLSDGMDSPAPSISPDRIWPRLLQEVQLTRQFELPTTCDPSMGHADYTQQN